MGIGLFWNEPSEVEQSVVNTELLISLENNNPIILHQLMTAMLD